jgi:prevent-host-death family protein
MIVGKARPALRNVTNISQLLTRRSAHRRCKQQATVALTSGPANIILNIMKTSDTISTHQMRFEFERVLQAVKAGRSLTLTYRNKPLARIVPLKEEQALPEDDPIFRLDDFAEPIGPLTNAEIDALVYGQ